MKKEEADWQALLMIAGFNCWVQFKKNLKFVGRGRIREVVKMIT